MAAELLWNTANSLIKFSILHLYVQVFTTRGFRKLAYAMMVVVASFMLSLILSQFPICRPFAKNWEPLLAGTCGDSIKTVIGVSVVNVCVDLTIIVLPMPILWRLQMATKRKVALSAIFGLGTMYVESSRLVASTQAIYFNIFTLISDTQIPRRNSICVITILRVVAAVQFNMLDFTYDLAKLAIWTDLEPTLGMINACLPVMQPALRRVFGTDNKIVSRTATSSSAARLHTESTRKSKFRKLDNSYALTGAGVTETYVGTSGVANSLGEDLEGYPGEATVKGKDGIRVQRNWHVTSGC